MHAETELAPITWTSSAMRSANATGAVGTEGGDVSCKSETQTQHSRSVEQQAALTYVVDVSAPANILEDADTTTGQQAASQQLPQPAQQQARSHQRHVRHPQLPPSPPPQALPQHEQSRSIFSNASREPTEGSASVEHKNQLALGLQRSVSRLSDEEYATRNSVGGGAGTTARQAWYRCREVQLAITGYGSIVSCSLSLRIHAFLYAFP